MQTSIPRTYDGPVMVGEDLMTFTVGDSVTVRRRAAGPPW